MSKKKKAIEELLEEALVPEDEQTFEVPENWVYFKFTSILDVQGGTQPPKSQFVDEEREGYVRLVQIRDFSSDNYKTYIPDTQNLRKIKEEDILIARYGASVGRILTGLSGAYNVALAKVVYPKEIIDKKFLFWLLKSEHFQIPLMGISRSAQSGFNKNDLSYFKMPLPPLNEQKRIAGKVESLFNKIAEAKLFIEQAKETFEFRRAAILDKAYRGELTVKWREENGHDFIRKEFEIRELISELNQGWSPKCENYPSKDYQKWGVIKTTAIQHMDFLEEENKQLPDSLEPREKHELKAGDILITRAGPRIRVGVCCLIKKVRPRLLLCDKAYRFRANIERVIPEYLVLALNTPDILGEINAMKTGISESGVNLTQNGFSTIKLSIPPIEEQKEIVRVVGNLLNKEQKAIEHCNVAEKIDSLRQSILHKAFRGELGTNDPSEENAIELLKEVLFEQVK
jgi:type I restriction enzyme, S subunit